MEVDCMPAREARGLECSIWETVFVIQKQDPWSCGPGVLVFASRHQHGSAHCSSSPADVTCIIIRYLIAVSGWMEGGTWGAWQCVCCCCCRVIVICDEDRGSLSTAEKFYKDMIKLLCEILTITGILNSNVLPACPEGVLTNMFRLCRTRNVQGCSSEIQDFFQQTL